MRARPLERWGFRQTAGTVCSSGSGAISAGKRNEDGTVAKAIDRMRIGLGVLMLVVVILAVAGTR